MTQCFDNILFDLVNGVSLFDKSFSNNLEKQPKTDTGRNRLIYLHAVLMHYMALPLRNCGLANETKFDSPLEYNRFSASTLLLNSPHLTRLQCFYMAILVSLQYCRTILLI